MSMAEKLQQSGGSFFNNLRQAAADNPAAAVLIGAGALMLLAGRPALSVARGGAGAIGAVGQASVAAGRASAAAAGEQWRAARDGAADLVGGAVDQVRQTGDQVRRAGHDARDAAAVSGGRLRDQGAAMGRRVAGQFNAGADGLSSVRSQLADLFERQPLALGAVGLAIGAVLAAAFPATRFEEGVLGETSDALRERAGAAADMAVEEARRQNLTPDALKDDARNAAYKASDIAADVSQKAAETFRAKIAPSS